MERKTKLGIAYDLEIVSFGNKSVEYMVTCEEGSRTFELSFPFDVKDDNTLYGQLQDGDCSLFSDDDLEMADAWIDDVTIRFLSAELASIALANCDNGILCSSSVNCFIEFETITAHITKVDVKKEKSIFHHTAHGEQEIKDLIQKLK